MKEIRTVYMPVKKMCEITYYIELTPIYDPHFKHEPSIYYRDENQKIKYFGTREEAENFINKKINKNFWLSVDILEKVDPIEN